MLSKNWQINSVRELSSWLRGDVAGLFSSNHVARWRYLPTPGSIPIKYDSIRCFVRLLLPQFSLQWNVENINSANRFHLPMLTNYRNGLKVNSLRAVWLVYGQWRHRLVTSSSWRNEKNLSFVSHVRSSFFRCWLKIDVKTK